MSIELFELKRGRAGKLLFYADNKQYQELEAVFEHYRLKTGLVIDSYSDVELSSGLSVLLESAREIVNSLDKNSLVCNEFLAALLKADSEGKSVIFLGE